MRINKVKDMAIEFAIDIVELCKTLQGKESVMSKQLLRSGTSIGANIHEADYAQGKMDFLSKLKIALKESHESEYWLELLFKTQYIDSNTYINLKNKCGSIRRILIASCSTIEKN
ncbi:four helix bundle protein [Bacteroides sp. Phil13]|uniref:four helix bundle protein n=1 Tax=Bacteroides sp. Phil13 TaxID=1929999 RepID=UPI000AB80735|nr:four helix bundle protein [Bacteroides sp. Phil13]